MMHKTHPTPDTTDEVAPSSVISSRSTQPADQQKSSAMWWLSTFFISAPIILYSQGRAYAESYIRELGLSSSLFTISLEDAYWIAFDKWILAFTNAPSFIWNNYAGFLVNNAILISVAIMVPVGMKIINKNYAHRVPQMKTEKINHWFRREIINWDKYKDRVRSWALPWLPATLITIIPLLLIYVSIISAIVIVVTIGPFHKLGAEDARHDCASPAVNFSVVHYHIRETIQAEKPNPLSARLLHCNASFCAVVRDGKPSAIPVASVESIIGARQDDTSSDSLQTEERLCFSPSDA